MQHATTTLCVLAAALALGGCATEPRPNAALEHAQSRFETARSGSDVPKLAPVNFKQADDSLKAAEKAWREKEDKVEIDHLSYLAEKQLEVSESLAEKNRLETQAQQTAAERDRIRLASRTAEAQLAQQKLAAAQAQAQAQAAKASELQSQLQDLNAKKTDRGVVVTMGDILFDTGKAELKPDANRSLEKLAAFFAKNPERTAAIEGFTDSVGSNQLNQSLSERRAQAVANSLIAKGATRANLSVKGNGASQFVATNDTKEGRQANRRVEIIFAE